MNTLQTAFASLVIAASMSACRTPPTEIVLRVETDMPQGPGHVLTSVRVRVAAAGEGGVVRSDRTYQLGVGGMTMLPADLGITPRDNDGTRTIDVQVTPMSDTGELFTYHAIAPFESQHTNELLVFLADRCRDPAARAMCLPDQTCGRDGCEAVAHSRLDPFDPDASRDGSDSMDSRVDATADVPNDLTDTVPPCGTGLVRCGGVCVDVSSSAQNCGTCGNDCTTIPNTARGTCMVGMCAIACDPNRGDCDGVLANGCETDLTTSQNCGACTTQCTGGTLCGMRSGAYGCVSSCTAPTPMQCGSNCVDPQSDTDNCGTCGNICPVPTNGVPSCTAGVCGVVCDAGFHLCSGACVSNSAVATCGARCSACPAPPHASASCVGGSACSFMCLPGYADCNGVASDGCEADLSSPSTCGACSACPGSLPICQPTGSTYACAASCTAGAPCTLAMGCQSGVISCSTGTPRCTNPQNITAGTTCPLGVCNGAGACVACSSGMLCTTSNECENATIACNSGGPVCSHASNKAPGTPCTGGVCNGSGACVPCNAGSSCNTGNPCTTGGIICSSGTPQCAVNGNAGTGTPCGGGDAGTGTCNGSGSCSTCSGGASCQPSNPCQSGTIVCPGGSCGNFQNLAPGTPCPGGVCNGTGSCNACSPGVDCSPNECVVQTYDCGMGFPMCMFQYNQAPGTPCTQTNGVAGVCNGSGACVSQCMSGQPCAPINECWAPGFTFCTGDVMSCSQTPQPFGTSCNAGRGMCDGSGNCLAGTVQDF